MPVQSDDVVFIVGAELKITTTRWAKCNRRSGLTTRACKAANMAIEFTHRPSQRQWSETQGFPSSLSPSARTSHDAYSALQDSAERLVVSIGVIFFLKSTGDKFLSVIVIEALTVKKTIHVPSEQPG
jgi:hypothetical protein